MPEVLIQNEGLSEEFYEILEDENLDEAQQAKLEKRFSKEVEVIKRDDRLEKIARDIVYHFSRRGYLGKGLFVAVDKFTAVKMYDKVQDQWKAALKEMVGRISIIYSTLVTRQHVAVDVLAGLMLGVMAAYLSLRHRMDANGVGKVH